MPVMNADRRARSIFYLPVCAILAALQAAAPLPAAEGAARPASGVIDSVLLRWRAQLKGCGQ